MKKIISIILVSILTLTLFTVGSSAGNKNCANLIVTDASFSIDNHGALALAAPDFPVVGKETQYKIAVTDAAPETFVIKFEFNSDVLEFKEIKPYAFVVPMIVGATTPEPPVVNITERTENSLTVEYNSNGISDRLYFYVSLGFNTLKKGSTDIKITPVRLTDKAGENYEMNINTSAVARETYLSEEIPDVSLLPEYGREVMRNYFESYTVMTSQECEIPLSSAVQNADNCNVKYLRSPTFIYDVIWTGPITGDRIIVTYGDATVFETEIVLLGDVNGDGNINSADARIVLRYSACIEKNLSEGEKLAADVTDGKSTITAADAREILRFSAGTGKTYDQWYEYHCENVR